MRTRMPTAQRKMPVGVSLPTWLAQRLKRQAALEGVTVSEIAQRALEYELRERRGFINRFRRNRGG